jgi:ABC-2 type transport system ATP-binding protein
MHGVTPGEIAALKVENVSHAYGARRALAGVSFTLPASTFTVLLGLNGAGKSTLFSLITRLYGTQEGRIAIFDHDVARASGEALRRLGVVFQPRTLDLDLSVMQNLRYHAALHGIGPGPARLRAQALLQRVGLEDRAGDKVRNLSGGQMRRVEIARALLHRPQLLVLDEPTVGLDIKARADILAHAHRLVAEDGVCVLWATHLVDEIDERDRVIVLHRGRLLAHGMVAQVVAANGGVDIRAAFTALTQERADAGEAL